MKKIVTTFLALLMLVLSVTPACAAEVERSAKGSVMTPNYTYIWLLSSGLTINSRGKAHCMGSVNASSNSYQAELTVALQKYASGKWEEIQSWSDSGSGQSNLMIDKYHYVESGKYRVHTTAKIYNSFGNLLETQSYNSQEKTY